MSNPAIATGAIDGVRGAPRRGTRSWAEAVLDPASGLRMLSIALIAVYGIVPLVVYTTIVPTESFLLLSQITGVGVVAMWIGAAIPLVDSRFRADATRIEIDWRLLVGFTWGFFGLFLLVTFATAPSIPLMSALRGADPDVLSQERGDFLKGRQGAAIALLYISAILVNTLLPYTIVLLYSVRHKLRHVFAFAFFLFSVSFLQKALFLNLVVPLLALFALRRRLRGGKATTAIVASVVVLLAGVYLTFGTSAAGGGPIDSPADVLTAQFAPTSPVQYFIWRLFAVPIFTATDTLLVHASMFDGRPLLGATSTLLSSVFGMENVKLERFVFEYQFGGWNDTANANSFFLADGFVNFWWVGVVGFGAFVGQVFRWFRITRDVAFASLWPLWALAMFTSPLIGMMLSNGFIVMVFFALFMKSTPKAHYARVVAPPEIPRDE